MNDGKETRNAPPLEDVRQVAFVCLCSEGGGGGQTSRNMTGRRSERSQGSGSVIQPQGSRRRRG